MAQSQCWAIPQADQAERACDRLEGRRDSSLAVFGERYDCLTPAAAGLSQGQGGEGCHPCGPDPHPYPVDRVSFRYLLALEGWGARAQRNQPLQSARPFFIEENRP